ncbi:MAG TPA: hypothetical protein P5087_00610 [Eubacteriales bacterium]|nr:hypothetical protein [Eubacteriales bacterium]
MAKVDELVNEIKQNEDLIDQYHTDLEYRKTVEYIVEWATENEGMLTQDQLNWIAKLGD